MKAMPTHEGDTCGKLPPRQLVDALVDVGPLHWLWDGDFKQFDDIRVAVLRWAPLEGGTEALYVVARVLWAHEHGGRPPRRFRNDCGLSTCVRSDHFLEIPTRDQVPAPSIQEGIEARALAYGDLTHVMRADADWFVCGIKPARGASDAPGGGAITCRDCADTLRALGEAKERV